jgi:hypothetical protein
MIGNNGAGISLIEFVRASERRVMVNEAQPGLPHSSLVLRLSPLRTTTGSTHWPASALQASSPWATPPSGARRRHTTHRIGSVQVPID